jgi:hypothetical protein
MGAGVTQAAVSISLLSREFIISINHPKARSTIASSDSPVCFELNTHSQPSGVPSIDESSP